MENSNRLILKEICSLLDTYKGRDKVLRLLCYSSKLVGGLSKNKLMSKRFNIFSSKMSATRAVLRLLDDLPMLQYTLEYGFGSHEPDRLIGMLGVTTNAIDQIYYPIEKMAWLAEHNLISVKNPQVWDVASSVCWVFSIYLTLMKTLRYVVILQKHKACPDVLSNPSGLQNLLAKQKFELLTCLRLTMDFVHAVNTLPAGFLWSSKLSPWQVGLIATTSSILGLYQVFAKNSHK